MKKKILIHLSPKGIKCIQRFYIIKKGEVCVKYRGYYWPIDEFTPSYIDSFKEFNNEEVLRTYDSYTGNFILSNIPI